MTYMEHDNLPEGFKTILKELTPLLQVGSRYVLYSDEDEDLKIEYVLSKGRVWLVRDNHKVIFTGDRTPL